MSSHLFKVRRLFEVQCLYEKRHLFEVQRLYEVRSLFEDLLLDGTLCFIESNINAKECMAPMKVLNI